MVQPYIRPIKMERWFVLSIGSSLSIFPTSIFGLDKIRWYEKACLALALHPFSVSTESDGMKKVCWAQALHPISVPTESDGASAQKRSNSLHPITASATSDGVPVQKRPNSLHPSTHSAKSDGTPAFIRPNPMERPQFTTKNFRPQVPRDRKQDFLPSVTN